VPDNAIFAGAWDTLRLVLGILIFVALFGGFIWLSKKFSGGSIVSGRRIKVIDRMMLTRDSTILIVQVGMRLLAVGTGKGAPSLLCELSPSDFPEFGKPPGARQRAGGFWERFARYFKAGFAGKDDSDEDTSFAEVLRQISEKDPVPGAENAGDAGYPNVREEQRPPNRFKRSGYQHSIDNMSRLSAPARLDRRSRLYPEGNQPPSPPPPPPVVTEEERTERIDHVLDLIAQRQSRMDERNDTGELR
jgi:flagellar biogenesis protein FliO